MKTGTDGWGWIGAGAFIAALAALVCLSGCGITAEQRKALIDEAVIIAGDAAERKGREILEAGIKKALEGAAKFGATPEQLLALEKKMREEGEAGLVKLREEAEKRKRDEKDKELPPAGKGGGWFGDLLLALLPIAAKIGLAALGKRGGDA